MHEDMEERIPGPFVGDYAGLPVNDAARLRADSWQPSLLTLQEHQCKPHPSTYGFRGVGNLYIWQELDPDGPEWPIRMPTGFPSSRFSAARPPRATSPPS